MSKVEKVLNLLFNENERTCVGGAKATEIVSPFEIQGEYYAVNPHASVDLDYKKKSYYSYMKPRRSDVNVNQFRNFVFEIDSLSLEDQQKLISACDIDFSAIIYSGGKSYHCILCLEKSLGGVHTKNGIDHYKKIWSRVAAFIDSKAIEMGLSSVNVVDPSCKNPSRFTRYPEYHSEGRKRQDVLWAADARICGDEFNALLEKCPVLKAATSSKALSVGEVQSVNEFWKKASTGLKNAIRYPVWAHSDAGLYPEALKVVLWAIDETNLKKELLLKLFEKSVFRQYERVGYPEEKWYTAIDDGYRFKS